MGLDRAYIRNRHEVQLPGEDEWTPLALMVAWIIGKATEHTGQHRHYQANTVRDRVVLSTIFLGLKVVDDPRVELRLADVIAAINSLHEILRRHCQESSN